MRTIRLDQTFDVVFIHDALLYLLSEKELRRTIQNAFLHCRPGGVIILVPDCVRETFTPAVKHGGHDERLRGLRYLEWSWDPDASDTTFITDFAYLLREEGKPMRVVHDRHVMGLFSHAVWLGLLKETGFVPRASWSRKKNGTEIFVAVRPLQI